MKKLSLLCLGCALLLLCTACQSASSGVPSNSAAASSSTAMAAGEENILHADLEKMQPCQMGTETGYYQLQATELGYLIQYTDYATMQQIILCPRPECQHVDDTCSAWIAPEVQPQRLMVAGNKLLVQCMGSANGSLSPSILSMNPDGTERQALYTLSTGESFGSIFCANETQLLFELNALPMTGGEQRDIVLLNLEDGTISSIYTMKEDQHLAGVWNNALYVNGYPILEEDTKRELYLIEQNKPAAQLISVPLENGIGEYFDGAFYYLAVNDQKLTRYDLSSQSESVISENLGVSFPVRASASFLRGFYDGKLILEATEFDEANPANTRAHTYRIDTKTGETAEINLTYNYDGLIYPVRIISQIKNLFFVEAGRSTKKIMTPDPAGNLTAAEMTVTEYSTIPIEDYWNSVANYGGGS